MPQNKKSKRPADERRVPDPQPAVSWRQRLWEPCDIASVVFFRIAFAGSVLLHLTLILKSGWIGYYFADRSYHLKFYGFEWVRALGGSGMWLIHLLMGLAAIGVGVGAFYRLSAVLLFVTFTYTFLSEAALYQNHYYLMCLIAFLFVLIPAHR